MPAHEAARSSRASWGPPIRRKQVGHRLNKDLVEGTRKEMRGQVREWWGKLALDDLEQVGGKADQLIALLQQRVGYSREQAEQEFNGHPHPSGLGARYR